MIADNPLAVWTPKYSINPSIARGLMQIEVDHTFLPPEAKDVPALMASLVAWAAEAKRSRLPALLIAGLVHYQFVTIHP